jgi:extradiol dioxygenase family protein
VSRPGHGRDGTRPITVLLAGPSDNVIEFKTYEDPRLMD